MAEIKNSDLTEVKNPEPEKYKDIKPESDISKSDAKNYWNEKFKQEDIKTDDNGIEYREGDNLKPNTTYEVNGYKYKTDDQGRIISAEGKLRMRDPEYTRDMEDVRNKEGQEYRDTDDRGHLIGHQFGGSDKLENLVPMDQKCNQKDYVKIENYLADAVKDGADVRLKIEPVYSEDSKRPSEFRISYSVDGDRDVVVLKNGGDE